MSMTEQVAVARIVRELGDTERAIDVAIAAGARLLATVAIASIDIEAPLAEAQPSMSFLVGTQERLVAARSSLVRAHARMRDLAEIRGDILTSNDCPKNEISDAEAQLERRVA